MGSQISIGDEAPNFDLSSTEDAVLMLKDEVPRTAVVLYFFADPASDRARRDLLTLARYSDELRDMRAKPLAVCTAKMAELKSLQAELKLPFALLRDDRAFSRAYGVESPDGDKPPAPVLVVVSRRQRILWLANPVTSIEVAMPQVEKVLKEQPPPTANYPKKLINRWVNRWVN